jgi:hypothetical protein
MRICIDESQILLDFFLDGRAIVMVSVLLHSVAEPAFSAPIPPSSRHRSGTRVSVHPAPRAEPSETPSPVHHGGHDLMNRPRDRQAILTQAQTMRRQAQQMRQWAVRARQATVITCTQAQLTVLRALMPGATAMTCEITAVVLTQRGLLDDPRRARGATMTP